MEKRQLTKPEIVNIKQQLKTVLKFTKSEYNLSQDKKIPLDERKVYFQQACEKLYKIMIHILELKSGYSIRFHAQIDDTFYWKQAGLNLQSMSDTSARMNTIHSYFYEGAVVFPSESVDYSYKKLLIYADGVIERL